MCTDRLPVMVTQTSVSGSQDLLSCSLSLQRRDSNPAPVTAALLGGLTWPALAAPSHWVREYKVHSLEG
jgi:hypothetical protein